MPATRHRPTSPRRTSQAPRLTPGTGSNDKESASTDQEALGRSRGGLTTKVHLAADARARTISRVITPGQRLDAVVFEPVMAGIRIRRRGRFRTRPVLADKAYSSRPIRADAGLSHHSERIDQQAHRPRRGSQRGRPPKFDSDAYKDRNVVERCINKL